MTQTKQNSNLHSARRVQNDEFYTQRQPIENEMKHYKEHFKGKSVLCNCDDPETSEFFKFFDAKFETYGLTKLVGTHYNPDGVAYKKVITKEQGVAEHIGIENGDFRSEECIKILDEADIVVTNPPFSLFREFVAELMSRDKKFLIIGNMNALSYKEIFPLVKDNKVWLGVSKASSHPFLRPNGEEKKMGFACWFTNLLHNKRNEGIPLYAEYAEMEDNYPKYDNYDAIEVSKTKEIPMDYYDEMGVPISFLEKHNPNQFEIVDINPHFFTIVAAGGQKPPQLKLSGRKDPYARIIIKRKTA